MVSPMRVHILAQKSCPLCLIASYAPGHEIVSFQYPSLQWSWNETSHRQRLLAPSQLVEVFNSGTPSYLRNFNIHEPVNCGWTFQLTL